MIHLLKASSKPVGAEYKRRIIPIAATLNEFKQEGQQFQMQASDNSKASKKKPAQQSRGQSNDEAANAKDPNPKPAAATSKVKPVGDPVPNPVFAANVIQNAHMVDEEAADGYRDMSNKLTKSGRNISKPGQYN